MTSLDILEYPQKQLEFQHFEKEKHGLSLNLLNLAHAFYFLATDFILQLHS